MRFSFLTFLAGLLLLSGCSVFGNNGVKSAPYKILASDKLQEIEVRNYESMILVSASIDDNSNNSAFRKLFKYISGANEGSTEIAMTAPVFMDKNDKGSEIPMTAPVFMAENISEPSMSFVMPTHFTRETTPKPTDPTLRISEINDYKVVAIKFSGMLSNSNVEKHTQTLKNWLQEKGYEQAGKPLKAGYNGPLTIPVLRHNEVLIEIK